MAGTAFDALADKGVKVLVGGVEPSGGRQSDDTLAFYDNTARVDALYEAMSVSAVANGGADAQVLWLKLMDSTTTRSASDKGIAKARGAVPDLRRRHGRVHHRQPRQAALGGECGAGLAPGHQPADRPRGQLRPARAPGRAERRVRRQGQGRLVQLRPRRAAAHQGRPAGLRPRHPGHLRGLEVRQRPDAAAWPATRSRRSSPRTWSPATSTPTTSASLDLSTDAYFTPDWFGDDAFKQVFLTAWGVDAS